MKTIIKFERDGKKYNVKVTRGYDGAMLYAVFVYNRAKRRFDGAETTVYHRCETNGEEMLCQRWYRNLDELKANWGLAL